PRFAVSSSKFVPPRTPTEQALAGALAEVMKVERASIEDHFFHDLGAHSLLMARFGAEIRKRLNISAVSMQDIYLNPTIEKLARHIDSLPADTYIPKRGSSQGPFQVPSVLAYYGCGKLQLLYMIVATALG